MKKIKIAIVGYGGMGKWHCNLSKSIEELEFEQCRQQYDGDSHCQQSFFHCQVPPLMLFFRQASACNPVICIKYITQPVPLASACNCLRCLCQSGRISAIRALVVVLA